MMPHHWVTGYHCVKTIILPQKTGNWLTSDAVSYPSRMETLAVLLQKPKITKYMLFNDVYFHMLKSEREILSLSFLSKYQ